MNVLVIEYEKLMVQKIRDLLLEMDDSIHIVGVTEDMIGAADWLSRNRVPDIILANESILSGIESCKRKDIKATVTISTTNEKYNFDAFRYNTIRDIIQSLPKIDERRADIQQFTEDNSKIIPHGSFKERFLVKQGQRLISVPVSDIAYFFSQERFIFIRTKDNQKFLLEYRIEQLENLLSPIQFYRVNRSFIISLSSVREIHSYFGNRLKLYLTPTPEKEVIVSRKRVSEFKQWLDK